MLATLGHWMRLGFLRGALLVERWKAGRGADAAMLLAILVPLTGFLVLAGLLFALGASPIVAALLGLLLAAAVLLVCLAGVREASQALHERIGDERARYEQWSAQRAAEQAAQRAEREADAEAARLAAAGIRHFSTALAGLNHRNADGSDRRANARRCRRHERLVLEREPANPVDPNAVAVRRRNGRMLGYIPDYIAEDIADGLERGRQYRAVLEGLLRPDERFPRPGTLVAVIVADADVRDEDVQRYVDEHFPPDPPVGWGAVLGPLLVLAGLLAALVWIGRAVG